MKKLKTGDKIPVFELKNQHGELVNITDFLGKKMLVIYFYPKNETAGCTKEACSFRDAYEDFVEAGAEVIGISSDSAESHNSFKNNHNLPFILLSDSKKEVQNLFGVPKSLFGILPGRVTYIVDKEGIVNHIFNSQLNVDKHISEALKIVRKKEHHE